MCKARRFVYHSTLGWRVIKQRREKTSRFACQGPARGVVTGMSTARKVNIRLPGKREFKLPWCEAGPPNYHDDKVDSDQ